MLHQRQAGSSAGARRAAQSRWVRVADVCVGVLRLRAHAHKKRAAQRNPGHERQVTDSGIDNALFRRRGRLTLRANQQPLARGHLLSLSPTINHNTNRPHARRSSSSRTCRV